MVRTMDLSAPIVLEMQPRCAKKPKLAHKRSYERSTKMIAKVRRRILPRMAMVSMSSYYG